MHSVYIIQIVGFIFRLLTLYFVSSKFQTNFLNIELSLLILEN
jgi:hypothetical protein